MTLSQCWKRAILLVLLVAILVGVFFLDTWVAMVKTWIRSETFAHGFLIFPISLWLIWDRWGRYKNLAPTFDWRPLPLVALAGFAWLLGSLANVLVVQEYAVVLMLIAGIWSVLGHDVAKRMMFPLAFLLFMVPVGKVLVPSMMEFTATFTVDLLRLSGIPVYREGMFFSLPTGNWSVVEACSGLRYLIASVTLGFLYAYLSYTKLWKRVLFVILSFVVPVIANGFRAYFIVLLGHVSDMKIAVGVDHLIYGWLFFGLVMGILFYIGSFWKDDVMPADIIEVKQTLVKRECSYAGLLPFLMLLVCVYVIWPAASTWIRGQTLAEVPSLENATRQLQAGWRGTNAPAWGWEPKTEGAASASLNFFRDGKGQVVGLDLVSFGNETQGSELVNSEHILVGNKNRRWRLISKEKRKVDVPGGRNVDVEESILRGFDRDLVVYKWYRIGSWNTANPYLTKALQVKKRLLGDRSVELQVILFTSSRPEHYDMARRRLDRFVDDWLKGSE